MAARKHTVILALEQEANVTLDLTYDSESESETPYAVNISVLNSAGEKFTLSGNPAKPAEPAASKTTAKTRKAG